MKLARLDLIAYGPFTDVSLDLSAGDHGLHVIYGPNEAGKSSCLRAITAMLYGIPVRNDDDFVHSYKKQRLGCELVDAGGERYQFLRVKRNQDSLLDAVTEQSVAESTLLHLLGNIHQEAFTTRFGINHPQLVAGGEAMIRGEGEIGEMLFAAGAGLSSLKAVREQLDEQTRELFTPSSRTKSIDVALKAHKSARDAMEQAKLPPAEWQRHDAELREAKASLEQTDQQLAELRRTASQLKRYEQALEQLDQYRATQQELAELGEVPLLDQAFTDRRRDASNTLIRETKRSEDLAARREELESQEKQIVRQPELIDAEAEIDQLHERRSEYQAWLRDLPVQQDQAKEFERRLKQAMLKAGRQLDGEVGVICSADEVRVGKLAQQYPALVDKIGDARRRRKRYERQVESNEAALAKLPEEIDTNPLRQTIQRIDRQRETPEELADAERKLDELEHRFTVGLKKLGRYQGKPERLIELAIPSPETIERHRDEQERLTLQIGQLGEQLQEATDAATALAERLQSLAGDKDLPSEADLNHLRQQREAAWQALLDDWPAASDAEKTNLFADSDQQRLADYQQLVAATDTMADRLRRDAQLVADRAHFTRQLEVAEQKAETLRGQSDKLHATQQLEEQQWRDLWKPFAIDPLPPKEMYAWHQRYVAVCNQEEQAANARREIGRKVEGNQALRDVLEIALQPFDSSPSGEESLEALLDHASDLLDRLEDARQHREQLVRDRDQQADNARHEAESLAEAEGKLAEWRDEWREAVRPLGLREDVTADEASQVLSDLRDAVSWLDKKHEKEMRVSEMQAARDDYERAARQLVERLAPELAAGSPLEALPELRNQLTAAREAETRYENWHNDWQQLETECRDNTAAIEQAEATLRALCAEAGCESAEALPKLEEQSRRRQQVQGQLDSLASQLRIIAEGEPLEAFLAAIEQQDRDELPQQRQQAEQQIGELDCERDELLKRITNAENWLSRHDGSAAAAEAGVEVQHQLAVLRRDAARYARLKLADVVLRNAIERYREKNESGLLRRAGEMFQQLTLGRFDALRSEMDDSGQSILCAVPHGSGNAIGVEAMSDGTADQLYLALRLASLEKHYAERGPLPFIVDDILNRYDDHRAAAALQALAVLSEKSQVIFFTHHAHLVDLARECLTDDVLFVHELGKQERVGVSVG